MANKEHLALLKQGVDVWNQWRGKHESIGPDLSGADLSGADLSGADLSGADLSGANLSLANLSEADLTEANLTEANLSGANLSGADLSEAILSLANLSGANLSKAILSGVHLSPIKRLDRLIILSNPRRANLSKAILSKAILSGADLSGADLGGADLSGADLSGADLSEAILSLANLSEANLSGANLSKAILSRRLGGSIFIPPNSSRANLSKANLSKAILSRAELSGADLSGADLSGADLSGADLTEADLTGTILRRVNISTAVFRTVQFTAYYPREVQVNIRHSFLLYAHTKDATVNIEIDIKKFIDELDNKVPPPKTAKQTAQIRLDTPITIVPECDQIEFDPPSLTEKWGGEWTRFGFDFRPTQAMSGDTLFIRVSIQVATVEVAHINCAVEVIDQKADSTQHIEEAENPLAEAKLNSKTSELYQRIFISYSRKDKDVVNIYQLVQEAVGNIAFTDTYSIRAGEDWRSALAFAIDEADIFQLFWSDNSAQSENVHIEWEYALKHKCPKTRCVGFIRPVCWNDPIKPSPPEELDHLNFKYVPLDRKRIIFSRLWARIVSLFT